MKLLLCVNNDLPSLYAVNLLRVLLSKHTTDIILSLKVGSLDEKNEQLSQFREKLSLDYVLARQPKSSLLLNFSQLQGQHVIRSLMVGDINQLIDTPYELIISIRYGHIIRQPIINATPLGVINLHSGLLPQYRGIMSTFWCMLDQNKNIGYTIHWIEGEELDAGSIIIRQEMLCHYKKAVVENVLRIYSKGCKDLSSLVELLSHGKKPPSVAHNQKQSRYFSLPRKHDVDQAIKHQLTLINAEAYEERILPAIFNMEIFS